MGAPREDVVRAVPRLGPGAAAAGGIFALGLTLGAGELALVHAPWVLVAVAFVAALTLWASVWAIRRDHVRLMRLAIEPSGVRVGDALEPWSTLTVEGSRTGVRFDVGGAWVEIGPANVRNWRELISVLRRSVHPARWRVHERRTIVRRSRERPVRPSAEGVATYRASASPAREAPLPSWAETSRTGRRLALLGVLALAVGVPMLAAHRSRPPVRAHRQLVSDAALAPPSPSELAGLLLGVVTALAGAHGLLLAWTTHVARGGGRLARAWIGPDAIGDGRGGVRSRDGLRHARIERDHPHAITPAGLAMQEHDARGVVVRSCLSLHASVAPAGPDVLTRSVARLPTAIDSQRHFVERPEERLGLAPPLWSPLGAARVLVLDVREDGVLLIRFSDAREHAGTTWHASRFEAEQQIEDEYGVRELPFREAPLDGGAISFLAYA